MVIKKYQKCFAFCVIKITFKIEGVGNSLSNRDSAARASDGFNSGRERYEYTFFLLQTYKCLFREPNDYLELEDMYWDKP